MASDLRLGFIGCVAGCWYARLRVGTNGGDGQTDHGMAGRVHSFMALFMPPCRMPRADAGDHCIVARAILLACPIEVVVPNTVVGTSKT